MKTKRKKTRQLKVAGPLKPLHYDDTLFDVWWYTDRHHLSIMVHRHGASMASEITLKLSDILRRLKP